MNNQAATNLQAAAKISLQIEALTLKKIRGEALSPRKYRNLQAKIMQLSVERNRLIAAAHAA